MPVRLHVELVDPYLSDGERRMLKRYGESSTGGSVSRDILIPGDMPLHNLHYALQRLFGWQNSHLRRFELPPEVYMELTRGTVKGWATLVGILFRPPGEAEHDVLWDDNYVDGSINVWLRRKYTGPYSYDGYMEHPLHAREDVMQLLNYYKMVDVGESFAEYYSRPEEDRADGVRVLRRAPLIELTLEEMNSSIILESGTESLLERLEVDRILAAPSQQLATGGLFPVVRELTYYYDYGDNWTVVITKTDNCDDLLQANELSQDELAWAREVVLTKHKPVCLKKDGLAVLDDVEGLSGYARFLGTIHEGEDKEEAKNYRAWARSLGWSAAKSNILTWL